MAENTISNSFRFGGVDQASDDFDRSPESAEDCLNIDTLEGGKEKTSRKGFYVASPNSDADGGFGLFVYNNPNESEPEILVAGSKLYRRANGSLTITYSGSSGVQLISLVAVEASETIVCTINVSGTDVFSLDLGVGFDEASITTVEDLRAAIDALSDFTCSLSGPTTHPAAMIEQVYLGNFTSNSYTLNFTYEEEVNHPTSAAEPFAGSFTNKDAADFENISAVEMNGVLYLTNLYDYPKKYDGIDCYRMGMPVAVLTSVSDAAGAVGTGGSDVYVHAITFVQKDAQGNETEGPLSNEVETTISSTSNFTLTVPNTPASSGFSTDCAVVAGAQNGVTTITVDNGSGGSHTMKVGQTAYFYDGVSGGYVEREITAKTSTTITIAGAVVNVADNAVISNNLRIRVYRTEADGSLLGVVADIPNNSFTANTTYVDSTVDASLGAFYSEAEVLGRTHYPPPKCKYFASFKNLLIGLHTEDAMNEGRFSDASLPEYWPENFQFVDNKSNRPISGGAENGPFFWVFKRNGISQVVGDLLTGQYDITEVSGHIGCEAHATIKHYDNYLIWLEQGSVFLSENGAPPVEFGAEIENFLSTAGKDSDSQPVLKRAVAEIDGARRQYLLFIPSESTLNGNVYSNTGSRVLRFDFRQKEWSAWSNLNFAGGVVVNGDDLFFMEKRYSNYDSVMAYTIRKRRNAGDEFDYADHHEAIDGSYVSGWVFADGSTFFRCVALKVFTNNSRVNSSFLLTCETEADFLQDTAFASAVLDFTGGAGNEGYGIGAWGSFAWGSPMADAFKKFSLPPKDIVAIRAKFSFSTFFNQIALSRWQLQLAKTHTPNMKI